MIPDVDPDPVFKAKYRSGSRSRALMNKNRKKFAAENKTKYFFEKKIAIYLSLCLHKGRLSYRSIQPSKENIQQ